MKINRWIAGFLLSALVAAGCGGDDDSSQTEAPASGSETAESSSDTETADADTATDDAATDEDGESAAEATDGEAEPDEDGQAEEEPEPTTTTTAPPPPLDVPDDWVDQELGILGGLSIKVPADVTIWGAGLGRNFTFGPRPQGFDPVAGFGIAQANQAGAGTPLRDSAGLLNHWRLVANGEITPTDGLSFVGLTLQGYDVVGAEFAGNWAAEPDGFASIRGDIPPAFMRAYVADLEDSVLLLTAGGPDAADVDELDLVLRQVAASATLTTADGEIAPLESPDDAVELPFQGGDDFTVAEASAGGPAELPEAFNPIEPGLYQVLGLGDPFTLDIPAGWFVYPNFEGFVVIGAEISNGPYRWDVRMHADVQRLAPVGTGNQPIGEGFAITDVDDLIAGDIPNVTISDVDFDATFGGREAVSFNIAMTDPNSCGPADNPCSYGFFSPANVASTLIIEEFAQRMWLVEDTETGPWLIAYGVEPGFAEGWFATADALLESATFIGG